VLSENLAGAFEGSKVYRISLQLEHDLVEQKILCDNLLNSMLRLPEHSKVEMRAVRWYVTNSLSRSLEQAGTESVALSGRWVRLGRRQASW
jgi:hypothetical protein